MRLSKTTIFFGLFVIISASFMRQVLDFIYSSFGKKNSVFMLGVAFVLLFLSMLWGIPKLKISNYRKSLFVIILAVGLYYSWSMKIVVERVHLLEYGLLAFLASRDLLEKRLSLKAALFVFSTFTIVAFLDEGFQYFLPYRVFDLRDIAFNLSGGLWGESLFLSKRKPNA